MNIWYSKEEINNLENILEQLKQFKKTNGWKIKEEKENLNKSYNKYLKYFQKNYWQEKMKLNKYEKMNNDTDKFCNSINMIISNIKDTYINYQNNLCGKDTYGKVLTEENYSFLYEQFIIIRNYLSNMSKEKMVIVANNIKSQTFGMFYKLKYNSLFAEVNDIIYDRYYNNEWYNSIKDYNNIIDIYNEALVNSWSYEKFYHISNAYKLYLKIKEQEEEKEQIRIAKENQMLKELPVYLAIKNPVLVNSYDRATLLKTKKQLIKNLQNANEEEQNQIIESLYQINLTRKM